MSILLFFNQVLQYLIILIFNSGNESDSDSDSSSSGEESSDEEEQKEKPKPTKNAKIKTSETNERYEDEDDDIIILDHDEFKDDISAPEQLMIHVNCYVTRDILAKPDQSTHTRITALVTEGDSTSYLPNQYIQLNIVLFYFFRNVN